MNSKIPPGELARYRATARERWQREQQALREREERAWQLARQAAVLLKTRFGASRVVVFGSLIHAGCFTRWSDVDIAAWSIHPARTFQAIGAVQDLNDEIPVNLVDTGACKPALLAVIEGEGVEL